MAWRHRVRGRTQAPRSGLELCFSRLLPLVDAKFVSIGVLAEGQKANRRLERIGEFRPARPEEGNGGVNIFNGKQRSVAGSRFRRLGGLPDTERRTVGQFELGAAAIFKFIDVSRRHAEDVLVKGE